MKPEKALTLRNANRKSALGKRQKRRLDHQDERAVEAVVIVGGLTDGWMVYLHGIPQETLLSSRRVI